ncbi:Uncharacterised protein [Actinomadura madurae]|nr:Uncharacterised protein [Actinomadura madurae]
MDQGHQTGHHPPRQPARIALVVHRYPVERTIGLPRRSRRLRIRWKIRDHIHQAFKPLAAAIIQ